MAKKIIDKLLNFYIKTITRTVPGRVGLVSSGFSGSNTYALFKNSESQRDIHLFYLKQLSNNLSFKEKVQNKKLLYSCEVVVTTHGGPVVKKRGLTRIDLWHGMPLKAMGYMDKAVGLRYESNAIDQIDGMTSYSRLYSTVMAACHHKHDKFYEITGMPRNDFLYTENGKENLKKIFPELKASQKVIFYMPTYRRDVASEYKIPNLIDLNELSTWLEKNNAHFVCKFHPNEKFDNNDLRSYSNITLLDNGLLEQQELDLYQVLNAVDLLITDYSSIYFDLLLTEIPALFFSPDLDEYSESVGFLLEPYEQWISGPMIQNTAELLTQMEKALGIPGEYGKKREELRKIIHRYCDGGSSNRVWEYIDSFIK